MSYPIIRPSLLNRLKSILECFINQDIKLIDFNNRNEPYLYSNNYSDLKLISFKKNNRRLIYSDDDEESTENESNTSDYESSEIELFNSNKIIKKKDDQLSINLDNKLIDNQIKSNIFKIDNQINQQTIDNKLLTNLSVKFNSWPLDHKKKYLDQLIRIAYEYINLKDYNRSEIILFKLLDIIFYYPKLNNLQKAIDTLKLLDFIYFKQNRFIELIEVNKLIINLLFNYNHQKNKQSLNSLKRIIYAYKQVNLDYKANEFIEEFNQKFQNLDKQ